MCEILKKPDFKINIEQRNMSIWALGNIFDRLSCDTKFEY